MNDERKTDHSVRRRLTPQEVLVMAVQVTLLMTVVSYRPLARLGLGEFEARHGSWPEFVVAGVLLVLVRIAYLRFFRREQTREEIGALREDIRSGRMKRMSLAARCVWLLLALALVSGGTLAGPAWQRAARHRRADVPSVRGGGARRRAVSRKLRATQPA